MFNNTQVQGNPPELYPNSASPRLPKPHVAKSSALPLMGYLAVILFGLSHPSSVPCSAATWLAIWLALC